MKKLLCVIGLHLLQLGCSNQNYSGFSIVEEPTGAGSERMTINYMANHDGIKTVFIASENPSLWQEMLIKAGYNVVDRSMLEAIINEQALSLTGLNEDNKNIRIGKIVGADAFILIETYTSKSGSFGVLRDEVKMVSVNTGEILFISTYSSGYNDLKGMMKAQINNFKWRAKLFTEYKSKLSKEKTVDP